MKGFMDYDVWTVQGGEKPGVMTILDAGHGGRVSGMYTTAPSKMFDFGDFVFEEGVQNRTLVKQLADKLKANNIAHAFTTISNYDESLDERGVKIGHIVSSYPKYHFLVLSVHANAGEGSAHGAEYWTTKDLNDSDYAANFIFPYLYDLGFSIRINRAKPNEYDKEESWKILRLAEKKGCMAILMEMGFFTNREEALKMLTDEWQGTAVNALYKGIVDIINKIRTDGTIRPT